MTRILSCAWHVCSFLRQSLAAMSLREEMRKATAAPDPYADLHV